MNTSTHPSPSSSEPTTSTSTPDRIPPLPATAARITRRSAILAGVAGVGGSLAVPAVLVGAQDGPPPIEPRDDSDADPDEILIEPDEAPESTEPAAEEAEEADEPETESVVFDAETEDHRYFAQTGHNLSDPFLQPWLALGGEGAGFPISEARFIEGEGIVRQDFETIALVYDPDPDANATVRGVPLPPAEAERNAPQAARQAVGGCSLLDERCEFFEESGQRVAGAMADAWAGMGGRAILGVPVSREFSRAGTTTQVFANAVVALRADGSAFLRKVNTDVAAAAFAGDPSFVPAPPTFGEPTLVTASDGLRLRSGPDATSQVIVLLPANAEFIAVSGEDGEWVPGYADGYAGWVSSEYLTKPDALPELALEDWRLEVWQGSVLGETLLRQSPQTGAAGTRTVYAGEPIVVVAWVEGEEVVDGDNIWGRLEDGSYVFVRDIGRAAPVQPPPLSADAPAQGKWIDIHLTQQLMVAYEGRDPVRVAVMTSGKPGWETPEGLFAINNRVANETMESGSIGAEEFYVLRDVLFTQYFTDRGHALHFAWWKTRETIGRVGSHGCINLLLEDARFFWDWADVGTPVLCRAALGRA